MTLEQEQALALAAARRRRAEGGTVEAVQAATGTTPQALRQRPAVVPLEHRAGQGVVGLGPLQSGVADNVIKSTMGVKQLFGGLSDADRAMLKEMDKEKAAEDQTVMRGAGDVATGIGTLALPGAAAQRTITSGLKAVPFVRGVASTLGAAGGAGATELITGIGEGDTGVEQLKSKLKNAATAAALGGATQKAFQLASKPFQATAEAEQLMKMDITPTLQQGAESRTGKFVGGMSGGAFASGVAERQNKEVLKETLRRIDPNTDYTDARLSEIIGLAGKNLDNEFDNLFKGKKFTMSAKDKSLIWQAATKAAGNEPDVKASTLTELARAGQALRTGNTITLGQGGMREQRNMIQDRINAVGREQTTKAGDVKQGLIAAKAKFDEVVRNRRLTPDEQATLTDINARMSDFKRLEDMAMSPGSHKKFKATSLLNSFAKMDPKGGAGFARAENKLQNEVLEPSVRVLDLAGQDDTRAGLVALKRALPFAMGTGTGAAIGAAGMGLLSPMIAAPLAAGYGVSLLGQTKKGAKALFGDTDIQRALAEQLRKGMVTPAIAGMYDGYEGEEQ